MGLNRKRTFDCRSERLSEHVKRAEVHGARGCGRRQRHRDELHLQYFREFYIHSSIFFDYFLSTLLESPLNISRFIDNMITRKIENSFSVIQHLHGNIFQLASRNRGTFQHLLYSLL